VQDKEDQGVQAQRRSLQLEAGRESQCEHCEAG